MDLKVLKLQILHGSLVRRLLLRAFVCASTLLVCMFIHMAREVRTIEPLMLKFDQSTDILGSKPYCNLTRYIIPVTAFGYPLFGTSLMPCKDDDNLTKTIFKEFVQKELFDYSSKVLCTGEGAASAVSVLQELGFKDAFGVDRHPYFSIFRRKFVYELSFADDYFDFVFSRALDKVSVPALLVLEIERVLRPGGTGALLVGSHNYYHGNLIRPAASLSSFLKSSDIVHVCGIESFSLVLFKKRFEKFASLGGLRPPKNCPSISNIIPYMKYIEPLVDEDSGQLEAGYSYLPNFMNISSRNQLVYINLGVGEFAGASAANEFKPNYTLPHQDISMFIIDHNASVLSSYVKTPGVTFIYHPGLAGDAAAAAEYNPDEYLIAPLEEDGYNFTRWFNETIADGDFVVLMMNARAAELKILGELFQTGAICHIDELFLRCQDPIDCKASHCGDCMSLFKDLRSVGIYAHQWFGD